MRRIAVGDIMTRNFVSVNPRDSLHLCAKKMAKERVNSVLITEGKRLLGIITSRDVLRIIADKPGTDIRKIEAIKLATKKIAVIKPSADISQALEKMRASNFRRLPVISNNELIGVLTIKDILSVSPELYKETIHIMDEIREFERKEISARTQPPQEGLCENCGALSSLLKVNNTLLCEDCREEMY